MMRIRNLEVVDSIKLENHHLIEKCITELSDFINGLYAGLNKEVAIEFNLGSKLAPYTMHLVIYNNPERNNNPYVFISAKLNEERVLVNKAELVFFSGLADYQTFLDLKRSIKSGFDHLPNFAFLSEKEIERARLLSLEYDER